MSVISNSDDVDISTKSTASSRLQGKFPSLPMVQKLSSSNKCQEPLSKIIEENEFIKKDVFYITKSLRHTLTILHQQNMASSWESWSEQQVYKWIQTILESNIDDTASIDTFMAEFGQHCVNGKVLKKMKEKQLLRAFKAHFKQQKFGIWIFVADAIHSLK